MTRCTATRPRIRQFYLVAVRFDRVIVNLWGYQCEVRWVT